MPNKYKRIEILEEGVFIANKIRIIYEDGTIEVVEASPEKRDSLNECYDHIINFAKQEEFVDEIGIVDLSRFAKSGYVTKNLNEGKKMPAETIGTTEYELDESHEENLTDEDESDKKGTKGKKKKLVTTIGALCLGSLLAISGGYVLANHSKNKDNNNKINNPFVQIVDKPEEDKKDNTTYQEKLNEIMENSDEIVYDLLNMVNGKLRSSEELDKCLENIANASLANMNEISEYVTNKTSSISGEIFAFNVRKPFEKNPIELSAVDYFNTLRDNVIEAAYTKKSVTETKKCVADFNKTFVEFVFGDKALPCEINGSKARYVFEDLSPSAKMTIILTGMNILNIEHDFSIKIDDVEYNRMVTIIEANKLNETIYQELAKTQQYTKTK